MSAIHHELYTFLKLYDKYILGSDYSETGGPWDQIWKLVITVKIAQSHSHLVTVMDINRWSQQSHEPASQSHLALVYLLWLLLKKKGQNRYICLCAPFQPSVGTVSSATRGSSDTGQDTKAAGTAHLSHPSILQTCLFPLLKPPFWLSSEFITLWSPSRCSCCWEADKLKHPCISFIWWKKEGEDPISSSAFLLVLTDPLRVWVARFFHDAIPSSSFISLMSFQRLWGGNTLLSLPWRWKTKIASASASTLSAHPISKKRTMRQTMLWTQQLQGPNRSQHL